MAIKQPLSALNITAATDLGFLDDQTGDLMEDAPSAMGVAKIQPLTTDFTTILKPEAYTP